MPTITNPGVIQALVTAYLLSDRNKAEAAIKIGYSENYAKNGDCALLFERGDVLAEIDRQEVELMEKTGYSVAQAQYEYEQARRLAMKINQPSAAGQNITGKARLHGLDKDAGGGDQVVIVIRPPSAALNNAKSVESEIIDEV